MSRRWTGGPSFGSRGINTREGAPSLRFLQGWVPRTWISGGFADKLRSVLPTLSHRTRKDGAPSAGILPGKRLPSRVGALSQLVSVVPSGL